MATENPTFFLVNVGSSKTRALTKISTEDAPRVLLHKWHYTLGADRNGPMYVRALIGGKLVRLHRFILNAAPGIHVDHVNGDTLDNRRENLRTASPSQNQMNSRKRARRTSEFKGVCWHGGAGKWRAYICKGRTQTHLGMHESEIAAARAYDEAAKRMFGEFAYLNFSD